MSHAETTASPTLTAVALRTAAQHEPMTITDAHPTLSWRTTGSDEAAGFEIIVEEASAQANLRPVWTYEAAGTPTVRYDGEPLRSASSYQWRVRLTTARGDRGPWSTPARFETGVLDASLWNAQWIADPDATPHRPIYLSGRVGIPEDAV
ncbi:MAG: hypothetical protein JST33_15185, partial [Actinobacteria bacterium]|nr:hypothetical protein [Actinomycetota bacterium]